MKNGAMGHILYKGKHITIRIRDVGILIILLLLFFFCLRSCTDHALDAKKEDKIKDHCTIMKINVNDLNKLLERSDLCSEAWFKEYDAYINRIKEQDDLLIKEMSEESKVSDTKGVYEAQESLLKALKAFRKKQTEAEVELLKAELKVYVRYYHENCDRGE